MRAQTLRMTAAIAAAPALAIVCGHLAWEWHSHAAATERQTLAFHHGIALAAILAMLLVAGRVALALERGGGHPIADGIAVAGVLVVLGHLAAVWRDEGMDTSSLGAASEHLAALVVVAAVTLAVRLLEDARS